METLVPSREDFPRAGTIFAHSANPHLPPLQNLWRLLVTCSATPQLFQSIFCVFQNHVLISTPGIGHSPKGVAPSFNSPLRHNRSWPFNLHIEATTPSTKVGTSTTLCFPSSVQLTLLCSLDSRVASLLILLHHRNLGQLR